MTANVQQGTLLDVLKKKMRQTKEEMEKYKEECEEYHKRLQVEINRREEVRTVDFILFYSCRIRGRGFLKRKITVGQGRKGKVRCLRCG